MANLTKFTIRVYGLLLNEKKEVLVADELINGQPVTKFPGGGMELGEGPADCLVREWKEELNLDIIIRQHFYTMDFFQESAFRAGEQVLTIYYLVDAKQKEQLSTSTKKFDFADGKIENFRWIPLHKAANGELTLPVDRKVGELLAYV